MHAAATETAYPGVGGPAWYDREIDWLDAHPHVDGCRERIVRLVSIRNAVARRYGLPERSTPLWAAWESMVACVIGLRRLVCESIAQEAARKAAKGRKNRYLPAL